jgi:phage tail sheath protein FI
LKCDHETTTPVDIDNGVLNVVVDFAPRKPAEFVIM